MGVYVYRNTPLVFGGGHAGSSRKLNRFLMKIDVLRKCLGLYMFVDSQPAVVFGCYFRSNGADIGVWGIDHDVNPHPLCPYTNYTFDTLSGTRIK